MTSFKIDSEQFWRRCKMISSKLDKPLLIILGTSNDVGEFNMNSALFHFLVSYELPETVLIVKDNPIAIASPNKRNLLQQVKGLEIITRMKDNSNLNAIISNLKDEYYIVDPDNIRGDFCSHFLTQIQKSDATEDVLKLMSVKETSEIGFVMKSGAVSNYLLGKAISLVRSREFSKDALSNRLNDKIEGVDPDMIDFCFDPEHDSNYVRLGVRYHGYCSEIARPFAVDLSEEYDIQKTILAAIKPGISSKSVLDSIRTTRDVSIYTLGLLKREKDFRDDFILLKNMVFCINIDDKFCNTFVLDDLPIFVTKKDSKEDYTDRKLRFRDHSSDTEKRIRIADHQKELLDAIVEEQLQYYRSHTVPQTIGTKEYKNVSFYECSEDVPRLRTVRIDWNNLYLLVPVYNFSIPCHVSTIKNAALSEGVDGGSCLRVNFKESKEIKNILGVKQCDTVIKSINIKCENGAQLLSDINELKKEYNKPVYSVKKQDLLRKPQTRILLNDLYLRPDYKVPAKIKQIQGNLEIYENGFKWNDVEILFSNIRHIFFIEGTYEYPTILHFNLKDPILITKLTSNVQFLRQYNTVSALDNNIRYSEAQLNAMQAEEDGRLAKNNYDFSVFVTRIEQAMDCSVQIPETGFDGCHATENVRFHFTSRCLIAIHEQPFFVLPYNEVEIANFERVTYNSKSVDCVFVLKNKNRMAINSIEGTRVFMNIKECFDNHDIAFLQTNISINWKNLIATIMKDPIEFYESGGWCELAVEDDEEDDQISTASSIESTASSDDDPSSVCDSDDAEYSSSRSRGGNDSSDMDSIESSSSYRGRKRTRK